MGDQEKTKGKTKKKRRQSVGVKRQRSKARGGRHAEWHTRPRVNGRVLDFSKPDLSCWRMHEGRVVPR